MSAKTVYRSKLDLPSEVLEQVGESLDSLREHLGCTSDQALAEKLKVAPKTISFWRNGRWTPGDRILIGVLIRRPHIAIGEMDQVAA